MWRALRFIVVVGLLIAAAVWFARNPGAVTVVWSGWRIDTSVGVLVIGAVLLVLVVALLWGLVRRIVGLPGAVSRRREAGRRRRGVLAFTRGLTAVAAGDAAEARKLAERADALLADRDLSRLLGAQAAQLDGDADAAQRQFAELAENRETEFLGLRGLLALALRRGDHEEALRLARRAYALRPRTGWLASQLFDLHARAGDWEEAHRVLLEAARNRLLSEAEASRREAVVLHERAAVAAERGDAGTAKKLLKRSLGLAPDFVPSTVALARLYAVADQARKAEGVIQAAWRQGGHPDLAEAYADIRSDEDPLQRVQRMERLAAVRPDDPESRIAVAQAALKASLWGEARSRLQPLTGNGAPPRVCRLMAEIEEAERSDAMAALAWLKKATEAGPEPVWQCRQCGTQWERWQAYCGACGSFDSLLWQRPARRSPAPPPSVPAAPLALAVEPPPVTVETEPPPLPPLGRPAS